MSRGETIWLVFLTAAIAFTVHVYRHHAAPCTHGESSITAVRGSARNVTTLDNLKDRGLVETQERPTCTVARITDEGYALIRSTGD